jgi:dipeptide/tripeptide permease
MSDRETTPGTTDTPTDQPATFRESMRLLLEASRGFWLVNQVNFGDGIAYFGVLGLLTLFITHQVGWSTNAATTGASVFAGLVTLFMLGAGSLTDWLGSRRALTLSMAVILVGRVMLAVSPSTGTGMLAGGLVWTSLIIMGVGEGALQPALYAGAKEYASKRTATMAYAFIYAIMNLGIVAGQAVSPLIRDWWANRYEGRSTQDVPEAGITGAFWFFIIITALVVLVNVVFFNKKVEQRDSLVVKERSEAKARPTAPLSSRLIAYLKAVPILDLRFVFFIFILYPVRTLFAHQFLTMPHYVTRAFPAEVGARWEWLNSINPLIIVIFVPLFAALTIRKRVVDMMIAGTVVSAGATFLLVLPPSLPLLVTYFVIFTLGEALWSSRFLEYVADLAPAKAVGIYMGVAGIPWFLAKALTGLYAGSLLDVFVPAEGTQTPSTLWLIYGSFAIISPVGLLLARRWLVQGDERARAARTQA